MEDSLLSGSETCIESAVNGWKSTSSGGETMDRASEIKSRVSMLDVIERYGYETNRSGFMRCPFHQGDHTASLKVYPGERGWHCFGCGRGGSVIDFVMELFGISFSQAIVRINSDFSLGLCGEASASLVQRSKMLEERKKKEEELAKYRSEYESKTVLFRNMWLSLKSGIESPLYFAALKEIPILEYWFEGNPWR